VTNAEAAAASGRTAEPVLQPASNSEPAPQPVQPPEPEPPGTNVEQGPTASKAPAPSGTVPPVIQTFVWKDGAPPSHHEPVASAPAAPAPQVASARQPPPARSAPVTRLAPAARQSYDINQPPRPGFGHAPDYSWISGELDYLHTKQAWKLRYANLDEEDQYGGSVLLVEEEWALLPRFKAGQIVRVEGRLTRPAAPDVSPLYHIHSICTVPCATPEMPRP
jgi:hypothetical protein